MEEVEKPHQLKILYEVFQILTLPRGRKIIWHLGKTQARGRKEAVRNVMFHRYGPYWYEVAPNCEQVAVAFGSRKHRELTIAARTQRVTTLCEPRQRTLFTMTPCPPM